MAINPLILEKIYGLDVPEGIKKALNDILEIEDQLDYSGTPKEFFRNIDGFLGDRAKNPDITTFCENNE